MALEEYRNAMKWGAAKAVRFGGDSAGEDSRNPGDAAGGRTPPPNLSPEKVGEND